MIAPGKNLKLLFYGAQSITVPHAISKLSSLYQTLCTNIGHRGFLLFDTMILPTMSQAKMSILCIIPSKAQSRSENNFDLKSQRIRKWRRFCSFLWQNTKKSTRSLFTNGTQKLERKKWILSILTHSFMLVPAYSFPPTMFYMLGIQW